MNMFKCFLGDGRWACKNSSSNTSEIECKSIATAGLNLFYSNCLCNVVQQKKQEVLEAERILREKEEKEAREKVIFV